MYFILAFDIGIKIDVSKLFGWNWKLTFAYTNQKSRGNEPTKSLSSRR